MNILTISDSAWDDTNSIGNTFSNFFSDWKNATFYNIYFRNALPNNEVCSQYYKISLGMLLKNVCSPWNIGNEFILSGRSFNIDRAGQNEKKLISIIHRYNLRFVYTLERILWKLRGWENNKLRQYLSRIKPDVIFAFALDILPNMLLIKHLKSYTTAKVVLFIADDVYGKYQNCNDKSKLRNAKLFEEMLRSADKVYGASEELCQAYSKQFAIEISPLYKGCVFTQEKKVSDYKPLNMVYAGNLLYGRLEILAKTAAAIRKINAEEQKIHLSIYSGTKITDKQKDLLEVSGSSSFCGSRPYDDIMDIMSKANITLHVESFEEEEIKRVRYSFSTKIIDCIQCGGVFCVIGPEQVASVKYAQRIPGTIVITKIDDLESELTKLIEQPEQLERYSLDTREFAKENHSIDVLHERLQRDFFKLIS